VRIAQLANFVGPTSGGMRRAIDQLGQRYVAAGHERLLVIPGPEDRVTESDSGIVAQVRGVRVTGGLPGSFFAMGGSAERSSSSRPTSGRGLGQVDAGRHRGVGSAPVAVGKHPVQPRATRRHGLGLPAGRRTSTGAPCGTRPSEGLRPGGRHDRYSAGEWGRYERRRLVTGPARCSTSRPSTPPADLPVPGSAIRLIHAGRMSAREVHHSLRSPPPLSSTGAGRRWSSPSPARARTSRGCGEQAGDAPVRFLGYVDGRDELARLYGQADISLSVAPTETFGLAVLEALACGTPVRHRRPGGARELRRRQLCGLGSRSGVGARRRGAAAPRAAGGRSVRPASGGPATRRSVLVGHVGAAHARRAPRRLARLAAPLVGQKRIPVAVEPAARAVQGLGDRVGLSSHAQPLHEAPGRRVVGEAVRDETRRPRPSKQIPIIAATASVARPRPPYDGSNATADLGWTPRAASLTSVCAHASSTCSTGHR